MVARREFVEWADVFDNLYGTSWRGVQAAQEAGKDILLDIDVQGHRQIKRRLPEAVSVFVLPPSFAVEEGRCGDRRQRGCADERGTLDRLARLDHPAARIEDLGERLDAARREITHWAEYDYLVVNDRLPAATQALGAVVWAARFRRLCQQDRARKICKTFAV